MTSFPVDEKPKPIMALESRPSQFTGISYWLVLAYKDHHFEAMLPADFMGLDETARDLVVAKEGAALRDKLRPILLAEDRLTVVKG